MDSFETETEPRFSTELDDDGDGNGAATSTTVRRSCATGRETVRGRAGTETEGNRGAHHGLVRLGGRCPGDDIDGARLQWSSEKKEAARGSLAPLRCGSAVESGGENLGFPFPRAARPPGVHGDDAKRGRSAFAAVRSFQKVQAKKQRRNRGRKKEPTAGRKGRGEGERVQGAPWACIAGKLAFVRRMARGRGDVEEAEQRRRTIEDEQKTARRRTEDVDADGVVVVLGGSRGAYRKRVLQRFDSRPWKALTTSLPAAVRTSTSGHGGVVVRLFRKKFRHE